MTPLDAEISGPLVAIAVAVLGAAVALLSGIGLALSRSRGRHEQDDAVATGEILARRAQRRARMRGHDDESGTAMTLDGTPDPQRARSAQNRRR